MARENFCRRAPQTSKLRLLVLTVESDISPFPVFLEALTGTQPADVESFAGYTTHPPVQLRTRYYATDISIWCDELPTTLSLSEWQSQMLSDEAREVRDVLGGIIVLLPFVSGANISVSSATTTLVQSWIPYLEAANSLRDAVESESGREMAAVFVLQEMVPAATASENIAQSPNVSKKTLPTENDLLDKLEETCLTQGDIIGWDMIYCQFHSIDSASKAEKPDEAATGQRNVYGEKTGIPRVIEVLETATWLTDDGSTVDETFEVSDSDEEALANENTFEEDVVTTEEDQELKVEQLAGLLDHVVAIREASTGMSPMDREKFAKREVSKLMKQL